jgi:hypothetical protein
VHGDWLAYTSCSLLRLVILFLFRWEKRAVWTCIVFRSCWNREKHDMNFSVNSALCFMPTMQSQRTSQLSVHSARIEVEPAHIIRNNNKMSSPRRLPHYHDTVFCFRYKHDNCTESSVCSRSISRRNTGTFHVYIHPVFSLYRHASTVQYTLRYYFALITTKEGFQKS